MRKKNVVLLLLLTICFSFESINAQRFEGIISIRISTPSFDGAGMESVTQRFYMKQPHMRLEVEGSLSDIVVLVDNVKREMYVLDFALNRYTTDSFDEYTAEDEYEGARMEFDMRITNQKKTVLNYETELLEFVARGDMRESFDRIEVWVTSQLGPLFGDLLVGMMGNEGERSTWQAVLIDRELFPLQTKTFIGEAVLEETEVVRIERRELQQNLFKIPPDFRQVDLRN